MITNLHEAKSHLSQLVQRTADGGEIVITVRGQPMARRMSVALKSGHVVDRQEWAKQLSAAAEGVRVGPRKATTQQDAWSERSLSVTRRQPVSTTKNVIPFLSAGHDRSHIHLTNRFFAFHHSVTSPDDIRPDGVFKNGFKRALVLRTRAHYNIT